MLRILQILSSKFVYLLVAAAWLFTIGIVIERYSNYQQQPQKVATAIETYIAEKEQLFTGWVQQPTFMNLVVNKALPLNHPIYKSGIGFFVYEVTNTGNLSIVFWNTDVISVGRDDLIRRDGVAITEYGNGLFQTIRQSFQVAG
ncbi:MAG: hypothetical protein EAZ47_03165, partial [Bacteroidetes bacterium]